MATKSDIGLADDPTTCAFCGLKVKGHTGAMAYACRAGLNARVAAQGQASNIGGAESSIHIPEPKKKSTQEQLDELDEQISSLEDKRKELLFEEAKEEARQDEDFLEEVHKDCKSEQDLENAAGEAREEESIHAEEAWGYLQEFGGHTPACLSGALAATQALHPLCTCGWNHVATRLEQA